MDSKPRDSSAVEVKMNSTIGLQKDTQTHGHTDTSKSFTIPLLLPTPLWEHTDIQTHRHAIVLDATIFVQSFTTYPKQIYAKRCSGGVPRSVINPPEHPLWCSLGVKD